jgi:hypothetical protein
LLWTATRSSRMMPIGANNTSEFTKFGKWLANDAEIPPPRE